MGPLNKKGHPVHFSTFAVKENHIFPIEAILKHKQVLCMRRKMPFTFFKYLFLFQIFKFLTYANYPSDDVIYSTKF